MACPASWGTRSPWPVGLSPSPPLLHRRDPTRAHPPHAARSRRDGILPEGGRGGGLRPGGLGCAAAGASWGRGAGAAAAGTGTLPPRGRLHGSHRPAASKRCGLEEGTRARTWGPRRSSRRDFRAPSWACECHLDHMEAPEAGTYPRAAFGAVTRVLRSGAGGVGEQGTVTAKAAGAEMLCGEEGRGRGHPRVDRLTCTWTGSPGDPCTRAT